MTKQVQQQAIPGTRMTATQFARLPETNRVIELINGEVVMPPSPMSVHQRLVRRISRFIEAHMPGGEVMLAPMDVHLDGVNVFQPDVFWLAAESQCTEHDGYFYGAPELVVEVLSPSTSTQDRREKFVIYAGAGVLEYWMVDPAAAHMEVWARQGDALQRQGIYVEGDSFTSLVLGKSLTVRGVFADAG